MVDDHPRTCFWERRHFKFQPIRTPYWSLFWCDSSMIDWLMFNANLSSISAISWCQVIVPIGTKNINSIKDHPTNIPAKFGPMFCRIMKIENIKKTTMTTDIKWNKGNAKRGISPRLKIWPGDLNLWPMTMKINRVPDSLKD